MTDIPILTRKSEVATLADELMRQSSVAIDLEMDSLHNYQEKVCLAQVSTPDRTLIVDPLAGAGLAPLAGVFAAPGVRKIFHAADYDLRSLKRDYGFEIRNLFDTMVSAQFCGEEKIGLADLLQKYFGVELDKKFQRADWSLRPLKPEMVHYAAEDTRHLHRLAERLEERLQALGRLSWAAEEFACLEKVAFDSGGGPLFLRFKGAAALDRRQLAMVEELLQWRDGEARRRNCPHFKVLGNRPLLEIARREPRDGKELGTIEGLSARQADRYGRQLLDCLERAGRIPESDWPVFPRAARMKRDPGAEKNLARLKEWRRQKAAELGLDPGVLINNTLLETIARTRPRRRHELDDISGIRRWQVAEFGTDLVALVG